MLSLAAGLLLLAAPAGRAAQGDDKVIDVRSSRPPAGNSFEALWQAYQKAEASGEAEASRRLFDEIRRLRIERNIRSLEELGLVQVVRGLAGLEKGERARAEDEFRRAIVLDPHLPDGYFGLALSDLKKGPLGVPSAAKDVVAGMTARLPTARGDYNVRALVTAVGLLAFLATTAVLGIAMVLRHGTLLLHDFEETFGLGRGRGFAVGVYAVLLFLPLLTFQGYGWLPLWWFALLFLYASPMERVLALLAVVAAVAVGPVVSTLESRALAAQNPLFRASALAVEGGPDRRAIADLEAGVRKYADDRDLVYLLALQHKKAGQYDEAAALYKEILRTDDKDSIALNNLANLEFARGEFPAAISRYKLGTLAGEGLTAEVTGTIYYNLSLAHLQKFERQPADEARSQADRFAGGLTRVYDTLWKYDTRNENAVVDLGLSQDQVWAKFSGVRDGVGLKNVATRSSAERKDVGMLVKAALNRFTAFLGVFAFVVFVLGRWRGKRMFTMRCLKCGTPFCKRCHLGAAPAGLCTQCYHLFVVRDGVSGPARNQKLLEVQKEDERRERIFRALSLVSPGAGHLYAQKTLTGTVLVFLWYVVLSLVLLAGRVLPLTEAPSVLVGHWGLAAAALLLLATYVVANRARPDFEVAMPVPRGPRRGGRAA